MEIATFIISLLSACGILSIPVWLLKKHIDKVEKRREAREQKTEQFMLYIMRNGRATNILAEATAKAVQRIPDAHCNGDMTAALAEAAKIQKEEKEFMFNQGVEHIFGN
jgi:hypothetical protein